MARLIFLLISLIIVLVNWYFSDALPGIWWSMLFFGPLIAIGLVDMLQKRRAIRRNFPVIGNLRYFMEAFRPEINQYFVESNTSGTPFNRLERSLVYQRAKGELDTLPFGTQKNVYEVGYEWVTHSVIPVHVDHQTLRIIIGAGRGKPYSASIFNIGAMREGTSSGRSAPVISAAAHPTGNSPPSASGKRLRFLR